MKIESIHNPRVKNIVKLRQRAFRDETGLTVIDGLREIRLSLQSKLSIEEAYICPKYFGTQGQNDLVGKLKKRGVTIFEVGEKVFAKMAFGDRKEGVIAIGRPMLKKILQLRLKKHTLLVVLDHVEKPGNLGAILRSCDGAGVDAVIVCDPRTDIFNPNVIRASCGVLFALPIFQDDSDTVAQFLKSKNIQICAATPCAQRDYTGIDYKKASAIVFGSEQKGLDDLWLKKADVTLSIPMKGEADSLNVSVSTAIVIYEALRQRRGQR